MRKLKFFSILWLSVITNLVFAQPLKEYNSIKEKYPETDVICSNYNVLLEINLKDNKPSIQYTTAEEFYYLGTNNSGYNNRSIHYSSFYELIGYKAYSLEAKDNKYVKSEVKDFKLNDFVDDNIFFDDSKELKFMFPKIGKGDKTFIENTYKINDSHILPKFSLSPYLDYENVVYTIKVNESIDLAIDTFSWNNLNLIYKREKKGKTIIHSWEGKIAKKHDYKSDVPGSVFLSTQIHPRIRYYYDNGVKVNVLENLDDLYKWNCGFLEKSKEDWIQFKTLSDSIVGNSKDAKEKAALIFNWVQNNIRYIAFEAGYEGQIPAKASFVCSKRYGDCKGIANLLFNLLKSQGLDAYLAWIGTRDIPYKYSELPTPLVDNHMICVLKHDGKNLFLDGTANNLKFGMPSPFIQGKEAMIAVKNCDTYEIALVPEMADSENVILDSCYLKIKNKDILGSGVMTFKGYQRMVFLDGLNELNYKYILDYCRSYLIKGNNRFILDTVWFENFTQKNHPLVLYYHFSIPEYLLSVDNESYININLDKLGLPSKIENERNVPLGYRFKRQEINTVCLELNSGQNINYIPKRETISLDDFMFENNYHVKGNCVHRNSIFARKLLILPTNKFQSYNNFIDKIQKNYSEQIILKTK